MRHRRRGRRLGRSSSHRRAMLRNLASSLILTERPTDEFDTSAPKVKGRVVTTLHKAKEVRPLVERCITIARRSLEYSDKAKQFEAPAERGSDAWKKWRSSDNWQKWCAARAPVVAAQRRALRLLGDKEAVQILFADIAPRFADRNGGYTRVLRLATPRLGDAGERAILEFVGVNDRVTIRSEKPAFGDADGADDSQADAQQSDTSETGTSEAGASEADGGEVKAEATDAGDGTDAAQKKDDA